jgi:hypothetical protein
MMPSLYCIFAREAPKAVIFRRGPSKQVRLIVWDVAENQFEPGQWFKGRIYAEKSDLSPSGNRLIYYAAQYKYGSEHGTWIALSNPPYLTATTVWPAIGTWNILSLFETDARLALATHRPDSSLEPIRGFSVPHGLTVNRRPWPGFFYVRADHERLLRDGWMVDAGDPIYRSKKADTPLTYSKAIADDFRLRVTAKSEGALSHAIVRRDESPTDLHAEWADAYGGRLYFSHGGRLLTADLSKLSKPTVLADFTDMQFEEVVAPDAAREWR